MDLNELFNLDIAIDWIANTDFSDGSLRKKRLEKTRKLLVFCDRNVSHRPRLISKTQFAASHIPGHILVGGDDEGSGIGMAHGCGSGASGLDGLGGLGGGDRSASSHSPSEPAEELPSSSSVSSPTSSARAQS